MTGGTDHEHGGGAGAHDVKRVRFPRPDDRLGCVGRTDEDDRAFAPRLLAQERAADRVRWHGKASWRPIFTYSSILIASGWLAGAWYAWQIDGDGTQLVVCLVGFASTLFPGVPWQELADMAKEPKPRPDVLSREEIIESALSNLPPGVSVIIPHKITGSDKP